MSDLPRERAFFERLDFKERRAEVTEDGEVFGNLVGLKAARAQTATLALGRDAIDLTAFDFPAGRAMPEPTRSNDAWFQHMAIVVSDIDRAATALARRHIRAVSPSPQTIPKENAAASGIRAYYFRDPEGHNLELLWFPVGKGDPRWQDAGGRLFLGVDHTGIASSDTARSLFFYRDLLGLHVTGESFNEGAEQEALSGVAGARVRITSLRGEGQAVQGVELLEYVAPRDGRPFPVATAADGVHWEIVLEVSDIEAVSVRLTRASVPFESNGIVDVSALHLGYSRAALVRDPDGHAVRIVAL